jgi:hypothetical protein
MIKFEYTSVHIDYFNTTPCKRMEGFKRTFMHILISGLDEFVNFTLQLFHSQ